MFKGLTPIIRIQNIYPKSDYISCIIRLHDNRIAIGSWNFSIKIYNFDYTNKTWNCDIQVQHTHLRLIRVYYICQFTNNILITSSYKEINSWELAQNEIILKQTILKAHNDLIPNIIKLYTHSFITCSNDCSIKIWNYFDDEIILLTTMKSKFSENAIKLLPTNKQILVSCSEPQQKVLSFWDLVSFSLITVMKDIQCYGKHALVTFDNGHVAVASASEIIIIETVLFKIVKVIKENKYIEDNDYLRSLFVMDNRFLIYACKGKFLQIDILDEYKVIYKNKIDEEFEGEGLLCLEEGKYIIGDNWNYGITVFENKENKNQINRRDIIQKLLKIKNSILNKGP